MITREEALKRGALVAADFRSDKRINPAEAIAEALLRVQREARSETAAECAGIADGHSDCGEFVHGGRYECADAIRNEIRAKFKLEATDDRTTER